MHDTRGRRPFSEYTIFGSRRRRLSREEIPRTLFPECCTRGRLPWVQLGLPRVHLTLGEATASRSAAHHYRSRFTRTKDARELVCIPVNRLNLCDAYNTIKSAYVVLLGNWSIHIHYSDNKSWRYILNWHLWSDADAHEIVSSPDLSWKLLGSCLWGWCEMHCC